VNGVDVGTKESEVKLAGSATVHARVKVSGYLSSERGAEGEPAWMTPLGNRGNSHPEKAVTIHDRPLDKEPYWHIERARIGNTRQVPVELVMNGKPVARKNVTADGSVQDVAFDVPVEQSSWLAVRVLGSSHTNPIFVVVNAKPVRASRQSAEWCLAAVNQCWSQKVSKISQRELPDAKAAYDHAREVYTRLIAESKP
ncbi:MAG TPA: hypothetical protein VH477_17330, partial [Bryobacteraceae bacterium]